MGAAAKAKEGEAVGLVLGPAGGVAQGVKLPRPVEQRRQIVANFLGHLHQPALGHHVIAKGHVFVHRAHQHFGRGAQPLYLAHGPTDVLQLGKAPGVDVGAVWGHPFNLFLDQGQVFGVLQQQDDAPGRLPGGGFVPGKHQAQEQIDN